MASTSGAKTIQPGGRTGNPEARRITPKLFSVGNVYNTGMWCAAAKAQVYAANLRAVQGQGLLPQPAGRIETEAGFVAALPTELLCGPSDDVNDRIAFARKWNSREMSRRINGTYDLQWSLSLMTDFAFPVRHMEVKDGYGYMELVTVNEFCQSCGKSVAKLEMRDHERECARKGRQCTHCRFKTHDTVMCPLLHQRCAQCGVRGHHRAGCDTKTMLEHYQHWKASADKGFYTRQHREKAFWGFFTIPSALLAFALDCYEDPGAHLLSYGGEGADFNPGLVMGVIIAETLRLQLHDKVAEIPWPINKTSPAVYKAEGFDRLFTPPRPPKYPGKTGSKK